MNCPKCNGEMEEGYINTRIDIWEGKISDKHPQIQRSLGPTIAYVCKDCGYVEFYRKTEEW